MMYGVDFPNEEIDYAADAAKRNVVILGERCEELKRENSKLRKALQDIIDYVEGHSTGDDDLHYFVAPIAEKALMAKAVKKARTRNDDH